MQEKLNNYSKDDLIIMIMTSKHLKKMFRNDDIKNRFHKQLGEGGKHEQIVSNLSIDFEICERHITRIIFGK